LVLKGFGLSEIVTTSNNLDADLFVSIHCNSVGDSSVQGTEVFWYNDGFYNDKKLATLILNQMLSSIKLVNRGVKNAVPGKNGLYVLKYTDCPAVLVELAFISNTEDEALLADSEMQDQFARAIARGITDYIGGR